MVEVQAPKAAEVKKNRDLTATPQRKIEDWIQYKIIQKSWRGESERAGSEVMVEIAKVTCRECYGFGHGVTKCPTAVRMSKFKTVNNMARSIFSTYRSEAARRDINPKDPWPLLAHVEKYKAENKEVYTKHGNYL